jgi:GNAT superfamily N-acetyltransferase
MEVRELVDGDTRLAHEAMRALRPAYEEEADFVARVDGTQRAEGYRMAAVFVPGREQAVAVAGFRTGHSLAWGHYLYVDDLSTVTAARGRGHAGALLDWLEDEGRRLECDQLHLDSATTPERFPAHRLYHQRGLAIHSHHFARSIGSPNGVS